jgi:hypothetical protein
MKRIVVFLIIVVIAAVAVDYFTNIPVLERVKGVIDGFMGSTSEKPEAAESCSECEMRCAERFERCREAAGCDESGDKGIYMECVKECADRYRACYYSCTGRFGKEECPEPSVKEAF